MSKRYICILLLILTALKSFPQHFEKRDKELRTELYASGNDTNKVRTLLRLSDLYHNDFQQAYSFASQGLELSAKLDFARGKAASYNSIADAYWFHADYVKAQEYYFKSLRISDSINDKLGLANSLYNIGWIICIQQENHKEIGYLYRALGIYKELRDTFGLLKLYSGLGTYYSNRFTGKETWRYYDSSLKYYKLYMDLCQQTNGKHNPGVMYGNFADLMAKAGDMQSARFYSKQNLEYLQKSGDSTMMYQAIINLAELDGMSGKLDEAIKEFHEGERFALRTDSRELLKQCYQGLYESYERKNNIPAAYDYFRKHVALRDSIDVSIRSAELGDIRSSYEIGKREASIKSLQQEKEIEELKNARTTYFLIGAVVVTIAIFVVAWLLYRQNRQKNAINVQLKNQNAVITHKKQEIENSIRYAKGIQTALLPDVRELKSCFKDSFVYYLPKDVVSGDFYWFHRLDNFLYCVAADCTGHGVPGALMSIVSMDKMTQAIFEKKILEPKDILSFLNIEIKKALKQHDESSQQRDGLDIALLRFNLSDNTVMYAGANRPLYLVRDGRLNEYKPDKVAIAGFTDDNHVFSQQSIRLVKHDWLYIFSDGYADQFGGPDGKKYMSRNFKNLLVSVAAQDAEVQEREIVNGHMTWKGQYEQVDDILVIGIKV